MLCFGAATLVSTRHAQTSRSPYLPRVLCMCDLYVEFVRNKPVCMLHPVRVRRSRKEKSSRLEMAGNPGRDSEFPARKMPIAFKRIANNLRSRYTRTGR